MTPMLWLAVAAGLVVGWLLRAFLAGRSRVVAERIAADRQRAADTASTLLRGELETVVAERDGLRADRASSARALEGLRIEFEAERRVLDEARTERDQARERAPALAAERRALIDRVAELEPMVAELGELQRDVRLMAAQRTSLTERVDQLTQQANRLESERTRAVLMADTVERQLKQATESATTARSLQTLELLDLKRQVEGASKLADQLRREKSAVDAERDEAVRRAAQLEAERRTAALSHQEAVAALQSELGAALALAERLEPLRRQLEDREGLIRSVADERDQAIQAALRQERDLIARTAQLERELDRHRATAQGSGEQTERAVTGERRLAAALRERDELAAACSAARAEIESLRDELKDRDLRFRALLEDRRHMVEQTQDHVARLREDVTRSRLAGGDDLKQIVGIGPHLEQRLKQHGVMTVSQIAKWSDSDIESISKELGPFAHRIRRDRWIEQAQRVTAPHGEPAA